MKSFELWRQEKGSFLYDMQEDSEELIEASMPGGIKVELNKLQTWWNENHLALDLWNPKNPKKVTLYPIISPPFDVIRSGGIAVIGYNPGAAGGRTKDFDKAVAAAMKETKGMPPVYDEKRGGWFYSIEYRDAKAPINQRKKRYSTKEEEKELSAFLTKDWWSKSKKKTGLSELGGHLYHAALNKMIEDMAEALGGSDGSMILGYREKLMHTNFVPFNSKNDAFSARTQVENASVPWMEAYIRTVKPRMIVCPIGTFKLMQKRMGMKIAKDGLVVYSAPSAAEKEAGLDQDNPSAVVQGKKKSLQQYYLTGNYKGIPVVAFTHWTGNQKGGPSKATWNDDEKLALIAADFARLLKDGPTSTTEVDWDESKGKVTKHKS